MTSTTEQPANCKAADQPAGAPRRALVADADAATLGLVEAWLAADGWQVTDERDAAPGTGFDLAIVDVPYPREGGSERLRRLAEAHPGTPKLVLSATLFAGVECCGQCARALGAEGVLPKPITRAALLAAVQRLAPR